MAAVVVCRGGVIGLALAMLLARDGHDVTVLERDGEEVPAWVDEAVSLAMVQGPRALGACPAVRPTSV